MLSKFKILGSLSPNMSCPLLDQEEITLIFYNFDLVYFLGVAYLKLKVPD